MARRPPNAKGRNPSARFIKIDHGLIDSEAFKALSLIAFKLLALIWRRHAGPETNGRIRFAARDAALWGISKSSATRALVELKAAGFIVCEQGAGFDQKRLAKLWRLTAEPTKGAPPTRDFSDRNRSKKKP